MTGAYRARLLVVRQAVTQRIAATWTATVSADDLEESHAAWTAGAVALLAAGQGQGVAATGAYCNAFLEAELGRRVSVPRAAQSALVGRDSMGRPLDVALASSLTGVRVALRDGHEPAQAMRFGLARAIRLAAVETMAAPDAELGSRMVRDDRFAGWRRVASAGACGACLASVDGALRPPDDPLRRHAHCRCVREPAVVGVRDRVRRPTGREAFFSLTGREQAELFRGRGGEEKAKLVRQGLVPFAALISRQPMKAAPDEITERTFADLAALANAA